MGVLNSGRVVIGRCLLGLTLFLLLSAGALARQADDSTNDAARLMACGTGFIVVLLVVFILNICLLVWVARDAKARGMDGSILWMALVFFTSWVGLIIYLLARPKGQVVPCSNCQNGRLQASVKCPHCGAQ